MAYELRHDFMAGAVDEAASMTNGGAIPGELVARSITYSWMKSYWTQQERNDWFAMYTMGSVPYPAYKARGL
jgi:hypothetical protein